MVCLGNICRSPLAESIVRSKLEKKIPDLEVDSAGTGSWHVGQPPDYRAIIVAAKYGLDISGLKGRQFNVSDFKKFDLILAMDESNLKDLSKLATSGEDILKLHLYLDFAEHPSLREVPDPYYGDQRDFEKVFKLLDIAADRVANKMLKEKQP